MKKVLVTLFSIISLGAFAQEQPTLETVNQNVESLKESFTETKNTVDIFSKIKISGYIQAQAQHADSGGIKSFAGGNFPSLTTGTNPRTTMNRMAIRRGRIKLAYTGTNSQVVFQFDITENGFKTKDAYFKLTDPYFKLVNLQTGIFNRPFGYEIEYSSSSRETPERSRMFQTLFPDERDMGAALEITSEKGIFKYVNFKGGWFTGNGIAPETDRNRDFIGHLSFKLPIDQENGFMIDGGVSMYNGLVTRDFNTNSTKTNTVNVVDVNGTTQKVSAPSSTVTTQNYTYTWDDASKGYKKDGDSTWFSNRKRQYLGGDIQMYIPYLSNVSFLGSTKIMAEYITGMQPGTKSANTFYKIGSGDLYMRNFAGYYVTFVQNFTKRFQAVVKYDVYDPNTKVSGNDIKTDGDIKYTTLGYGLVYNYDQNIKFTLYYDNVKNETVSALKGYATDLKDNVVTLRMQYKF